MSRIKLNSGIFFNFANPTLDQIDIHDVVHNLSKEQRFSNCLDENWSVLQHVILCWHISVFEDLSKDLQYITLHHDDPEYVMRDVPTPLKEMLGDYKKIYKVIENRISEKFLVELSPLHPKVKYIDGLAMLIEDLLFSDTESQWHNFNQDELDKVNKQYNEELIPMINVIRDLREIDQRMTYLRIHNNLADKLNKSEVML